MYKGILLLLSAEFCFTLSTVFGKFAMAGEGMTGIEVSFFRFFLGAIAAAAYMLWKRVSFRPNNITYVALRGVSNTVAVLLFFTGVQLSTVTNANMLNLTYPVFVFLLAPFINREKSRGRYFIFLLLALAGVYLIILPDFSSVNPGDLCALLSGLVAGFAICFLREARKFDSSEVILFYLMLPGCLINLMVMAPGFSIPSGTGLAYSLCSGAIAVAGQALLTVGYRYIEAARGSIVSGSRILFAGIMGVSIFSDPLTLQIVLGGALILVSLVGVSGIARKFFPPNGM